MAVPNLFYRLPLSGPAAEAVAIPTPWIAADGSAINIQASKKHEPIAVSLASALDTGTRDQTWSQAKYDMECAYHQSFSSNLTASALLD